MIVLWQFEECEHSQPVRQELTRLGVDYVAVNAPKGRPEKDEIMVKLFGSAKTPALWDTQTGQLVQGQRQCIQYVRMKHQAAA